MLKEFLQNYGQRRAIKAWNKSVLGQALANHSREYFYEGDTRLSSFNEKNKQKLISDFYAKVIAIDQVENPLLAMRENIADSVCGFAKLQVLCLKPDEKKEAFYADCPYISGTLYAHIRELSEHNEELKQLKWTHGDLSDDDLISFCNGRSAVFLYYVNGLNIVRAAGDDVDEAKDWLRPFIRSSLIWEDDLCRGEYWTAESALR